MALVQQHPIHAAVRGIVRGHRYSRQARTTSEQTVPDVGDAGGEGDAGQAITPLEGIVPNPGNAVPGRDVRQVLQ